MTSLVRAIIRGARSRITRSIMVLVALFALSFSSGLEIEASSERSALDWQQFAGLRPELKVLILVEGDTPISLQDLAALADRGLVPADRDAGLTVGLRRAVFSTRLKQWISGPELPHNLRGKPLERFIMNGVYRTSFKVEKKGYYGPLSLEVTAPREGFGRRLLSSECLVRPTVPATIRVDAAGNRWFCVSFPEVKYGDTIKFRFAFRYLVDMGELLKHDVTLVEIRDKDSIPDDVRIFLKPGYKINPRLPQALAWAIQDGSGPADARREFQRLTKYLKRTVTYDNRKRREYFGGRAVYSDIDDMYQSITETLSTGKGACPDTSILECAFLRARGIPCRTAGRYGHFYSMVYVPSAGWMSTSVTPTGIPLIVAPGPDHIPYQKWSPRIPMRTTQWEARVRIEPVED